MRSMKFSAYSRRHLQPTTFNSPFIPSRPVTLNSYAAFSDDSSLTNLLTSVTTAGVSVADSALGIKPAATAAPAAPAAKPASNNNMLLIGGAVVAVIALVVFSKSRK